MIKARALSLQEITLIFITMIWGGSYFFMQMGLLHCGAMFFVAARFLLGGILTSCIFFRSFFSITKKDFIAGAITGAMAFFGQALQTVGLETITMSQSAFLTALYVPLVPLFQWLVFRKNIGIFPLLGVALAFTGLLILSMPSGLHFALGKGDILTLLSAVAIAVEIVLISKFVNGVHMVNFAIIQLITCGLGGLLAMPVMGEAFPSFSWGWLFPVLFLGIASVGIQLGMTWAQKTIAASRAAVIYAGEPVWGAIFGRMAGDRLPFSAFVGGAFIVMAVIISEWPSKKK
ncbi:DMT family transporter [Acetobacteraceae bacterium]|nr:DMT family transporter [Acetobacteraceae bacterium]